MTREPKVVRAAFDDDAVIASAGQAPLSLASGIAGAFDPSDHFPWSGVMPAAETKNDHLAPNAEQKQ